jgi:hypothetical protein
VQEFLALTAPPREQNFCKTSVKQPKRQIKTRGSGLQAYNNCTIDYRKHERAEKHICINLIIKCQIIHRSRVSAQSVENWRRVKNEDQPFGKPRVYKEAESMGCERDCHMLFQRTSMGGRGRIHARNDSSLSMTRQNFREQTRPNLYLVDFNRRKDVKEARMHLRPCKWQWHVPNPLQDHPPIRRQVRRQF